MPSPGRPKVAHFTAFDHQATLADVGIAKLAPDAGDRTLVRKGDASVLGNAMAMRLWLPRAQPSSKLGGALGAALGGVRDGVGVGGDSSGMPATSSGLGGSRKL